MTLAEPSRWDDDRRMEGAAGMTHTKVTGMTEAEPSPDPTGPIGATVAAKIVMPIIVLAGVVVVAWGQRGRSMNRVTGPGGTPTTKRSHRGRSLAAVVHPRRPGCDRIRHMAAELSELRLVAVSAVLCCRGRAPVPHLGTGDDRHQLRLVTAGVGTNQRGDYTTPRRRAAAAAVFA